MAALLGVDLPGVIGQTFALGAAVAALAGTVVTLHYGEADFFMGFLMGFKALTAAMLGGIGSLAGALLGGLLLGLTEALWAGYFGSAYKDFMSFGVLVLVLVFRPSGILGRALP
jgi:branched-chain amino acid transport system permease protein